MDVMANNIHVETMSTLSASRMGDRNVPRMLWSSRCQIMGRVGILLLPLLPAVRRANHAARGWGDGCRNRLVRIY